MNVRIRGAHHFLGSNPLYVVDGFHPAGDINDINPLNEIESMTILMNAAATSLYGSVHFGVVLIQTKGASGWKR